MLKTLTNNFDFRYYLRFGGLFFLFYLTYTFVVAASAPTGTYYPFVDKYLNFPVLIREIVLHGGQLLLSLIGYPSTIIDDRIQSADGSSLLTMAWACYGLGLKSFWVAFVCAHSLTLKQKLVWSCIGVLFILLLNSIRVAVMMIALIERWTIAEYLGTNAHDLFNYLCYIILFCLILLFYARTKTASSNATRRQSTVVPLVR